MSEITKPVITKEQANSIEAIRREDVLNDEDILRSHGKFVFAGECLNDLDLMTLAAALINGYEVEKTPEEKVREFYESHGGSPSAMERKAAIRETLYKLGIKIEGVNA
ncbi:hypothetical protein [Bacillus haynesii]|uniref:hypothetical protein n=1 Tax=Bacillus haynesii TaxID=1925021 RepID=UPI001F6240D7|nr:hypothetical protein [Bacillus haynesii]MCI4129410.1 hypothetical protein [Bacillus haynesii]